jgi:hypothetical protein
MGAVDTTYTFTATDTITSTKMNNIIDQTTITSDAIIGTTLEAASGKLKVRSAGITSNELATNAVTTTAITDLNVTTGKIADLAVTTGKIADLGVTTAKIADSNVTTVKIADANVTPAKLSQPLTVATAQNSTSGTNINFTSIPSWAKRITVVFNGVSTNSTDDMIVQLGDNGGIEITGYLSYATDFGGIQAFTNGFGLTRSYSATSLNNGTLVLTKISGNIWVANGNIGNATAVSSSVGTKTLSDTITQIRISTEGGAGVFDAGSVNIMYE